MSEKNRSFEASGLRRWAMNKIAPVHQPWPSESVPPILTLTKDPGSQAEVYRRLRRKILAKSNMALALAIVVVVHVLDMWPVVTPYFTGEIGREMTWSNMFLAEGCAATDECETSKAGNLVLLASAYIAQFCTVFVGIIAIILFLPVIHFSRSASFSGCFRTR